MSKLSVTQHALGVDQYGRGRRYRSHFVTGPGSADYDDCCALVAEGLMVRREGSALSGGDPIFIVTAAGQRWMEVNSPPPPPAPKLTRSQRRYRRFLDADSGLPFGEWLKAQRDPSPVPGWVFDPLERSDMEVPF